MGPAAAARAPSDPRWRVSFAPASGGAGFEIAGDDFRALWDWLELPLGGASGVAQGWAIRVRHRSGAGFEMTPDFFETDPAEALLARAMEIDPTRDRHGRAPRLVIPARAGGGDAADTQDVPIGAAGTPDIFALLRPVLAP